MLTLPKTQLDQEKIDRTFAEQQIVAQQWRSSTSKERIERLKKLRNWIKEHQNEIREAVHADFRKPIPEIDLSEIYPITSEINHTIKHLKSWMKSKSVSTPLPMLGTQGRVHFEPKGVSLIISPWNYPFNLAIGPLVSALSAGCTAIIKPSEMTPNTSKIVAKLVKEVFSENEVAVFQGEVDVSQALLDKPFDHIFFTGSPQVGKIIMKAAAEHLTSVTLELGGKSPAIIQKGGNLKDAAQKLIPGKFLNCGQTCVAPDYILVPKEEEETLLNEMKVKIQQTYDPDFKGIELTKDFARIVNDGHFKRLIDLLEDALAKGAKVAFGGNYDPHLRYIEPTILTEVNKDMRIMKEEIFGPILPIMTYDTLDDAINWVNSQPKPLALYYFGEDGEKRDQVLTETSSGNAVVNDCVLHFAHNELPFGGVNNSGLGKAHGYYGFQSFSNEKGVLTQRVGATSAAVLNPPYGAKTKQILNYLIKWF